ncbi:MAG: hypothetical protein FD123_3239 [Bacteroidetes bacterium]|nr:MAG: hypothetical protein FD123_3239 [Bacteroidota bacterium]
MKENEYLFHFIKSLGKGEKRRFVSESLRAGGKSDSGYLGLYRWYERRKSAANPDAGELRRMNLNANRLAVQKNYLFGRLLDSLLSDDVNISGESRIRLLISKSEILFNRGLVKASVRLLDIAEKSARAQFAYYQLLDILERRNAYHIRYAETDAAMRVAREKKEILAVAENIIDYQQLSQQVFALARSTDIAQAESQEKQLKKILHHPLLSDERKALSPGAKFNMYHTLCHLASMLQDHRLKIRVNRRHLEIFLEEPEMTKNELDYYITLLFNSTVELLHHGNRDDFRYAESHWTHFRERFGKAMTPSRGQRLRFYRIELDLRLAIQTGSMDKLPALLPAVEKQLHVEHVYSVIFRESMPFYIALAHTSAGRYKAALRSLIDVFSNPGIAFRRYPFLLKSFILRLMIHYDEGHEEVVSDLSAELRSFITAQQRLERPEGAAVFLFGSFGRPLKPGERKKIFEQALREIWKRIAVYKDWHFLNNHIFFIGWMRSRAAGISWGDAIRETVTQAGKLMDKVG